jgi:DNA-binding transcriptional MerR regulator
MDLTYRSEPPVLSRKAKTRRETSRLFTIGDLAKEFSVSLRTLRFYEDRGLLSPHREGSARYYDEQDKARLALILKGKQLGFTLGEIRDLIATKNGAEFPTALSLKPEQIASQIDHLERQRVEIEEAIVELQAVHKKLLTGI